MSHYRKNLLRQAISVGLTQNSFGMVDFNFEKYLKIIQDEPKPIDVRSGLASVTKIKTMG